MSRALTWCMGLWVLLLGAGSCVGAEGAAEELLRVQLDEAAVGAASLPGQDAHEAVILQRLYLSTGFSLIWSDAEGLTPKAGELLALLQQDTLPLPALKAPDVSTLVQRYEQAQQQWLETGALDPASRSALDLQLTAAALAYFRQHLYGQFTRPEKVAADWRSAQEAQTPDTWLLQATRSPQPLAEWLSQTEPTHPGYTRLRAAWANYAQWAASITDWNPLPPTAQGQPDAQASQLRQRLYLLGDLPEITAPDPERFDPSLGDALARFQTRHGLAASGKLDAATIAALNLPLAERARQMALNLERWRWLPQDLGPRYILVNIPDFSLEVIDQGQVALHMPVIVGKPQNRTPLFSASMTYLVFSPSWSVPPSIAGKEIGAKGMHKFQVSGTTEDTEDVTAALRAGKLRLRQPPGPKNPLGGVKFMFPNPFSVYLHDTSSRQLFGRSQRSLSHGCVRVGKPLDLAVYLLADQPRWTRESISKAMQRGREQHVSLQQPIPVHLAYWTAWVDAEGVVQFRPDIYGVDKSLVGALTRKRGSKA